MNEANNETNSLLDKVCELSKLRQDINTCTNNIQTDAIILFEKCYKRAKNEYNNLDEQLENNKSQNMFVSSLSAVCSFILEKILFIFKIFSPKKSSEEFLEATSFESTTEKQQIVIENKDKKSLRSKAYDAINLINNENEINEIDNINNEGKGVEI